MQPPTATTTARVFRVPGALYAWLAPAMALAAVLGFAASFALHAAGRPGLDLWMISGLVGAMAAYAALARRRTLSSDREGLHFRSNLPSVLRRLDPDWSLAWRDLQSAQWAGGMRRLRLQARDGTRIVSAFGWQLDREEARRCQRALITLRRNPDLFDESILPLVRELREHGVRVVASPEAAQPPFDLASNAATRGVLIVAGVAAAFWFADAMVSDQMYVPGPPWIAIAVPAVLAMAVAALVQARGEVPGFVNVAVTALAGVAMGLAAYGGLQRLNQLAGLGRDRVVEYTLQGDGSLRPDLDGASVLPPGFFQDAQYWGWQKYGSRHRFVHHGALGFESLDIGEYRQRLKRFYGEDPGRNIQRP